MTDDNFQKLALNESFERVAKVAEERAAFNEAMEHVIHSSMPIDFERRYAMDNLIAQDADLIDIGTEMVVEVTEADRDAAAQYDVVEAFARHRQYGYDQGYYDGRKMDGMEERAKIVTWLRAQGEFGSERAQAWGETFAIHIEAGEHLQEQSK